MAKQALPKLTINLFGEGQNLMKVNLAQDPLKVYSAIADKLKMSIATALIDPFFYHHLNDRKIKSVVDLKPEICYSGLLDTPKNQLEIWFDGKKIAKLRMADLDASLLLFPLYQVRTNTYLVHDKGMYLIQREVGLIARFQTRVADFNINNLQFEIVTIENGVILQGMSYNDVVLKTTSNETLVIYQTGFEIY